MTENPGQHAHLVQFYGGDVARLERNVARFLNEAVREGQGALLIAGKARREAIASAVAGEVVCLDYEETLADLLNGGSMPDPKRFKAVAGERVRELQARYGRFRAYGEMVAFLWARHAYAAAIALEELWNELLETVDCDLFCGYPIDVLGDDFQVSMVRPVISTHTSVVTSVPHSFDFAMQRAMDEVFGDRGHGLRALMQSDFASLGPLPPAERMILRLRSTAPRYAAEVIARARLG